MVVDKMTLHLAACFRGITTLSITTLSIVTLNIKGLFATINDTEHKITYQGECRYAECHAFITVMLNVFMLNVRIPSVIMLNVVMQSVFVLNVVMLSVLAPFQKLNRGIHCPKVYSNLL
jgi:hypothetical protein